MNTDKLVERQSILLSNAIIQFGIWFLKEGYK